MFKLKHELKSKKEDLYSSLPFKRLNKKAKDNLANGEEGQKLQSRRKSLLLAMSKAMNARERSKYISCKASMDIAQKKASPSNEAGSSSAAPRNSSTVPVRRLFPSAL